MGLDAVVDARYGGHPWRGTALTDQEATADWPAPDSLVLLRGQWVEIDRERLHRAIGAVSARRRNSQNAMA